MDIRAKIKCTVNGREVSSENFADAIMVESIKKRLEQKLRGVRCPEHNQYPRIELDGPSLDKLKPSVMGCCEKLVAATRKALAG